MYNMCAYHLGDPQGNPGAHSKMLHRQIEYVMQSGISALVFISLSVWYCINNGIT
jgi:hypothetical protein